MPDGMSLVGTFRRLAALQGRGRDWGGPDMQMVVRGDHIGADDPQETLAAQDFRSAKALFVPSLKRDIVPLLHAHDLRAGGSHGIPHPTTKILSLARRRGGCMAARGARAAGGDAGEPEVRVHSRVGANIEKFSP
jgi:hypothetical protein